MNCNRLQSRELNSWDLRFLGLAEHISGWSKDPSTKVGAVITRSNRVVSVGFNGFPVGVEDDDRLIRREEKLTRIVHAEPNAMIFAQQDLTGCTLYTHPFMPCSSCAGMVIQYGIRDVVSRYRDDLGRWADNMGIASSMFAEAGVVLTLAR